MSEFYKLFKNIQIPTYEYNTIIIYYNIGIYTDHTVRIIRYYTE